MSGPVRFWLSMVVLLGLGGGGIYLFQRPAGSPEATPRPTPHREASPRPSKLNEGAPTGATPIMGRMSTWAATYREHMAPVATVVAVFESAPAQERAVCNQLLTSTYSARAEIPEAQDPDVDRALRSALSQFAEAGSFCLQQQPGLQDTYLLLARSGITLAESVLLERYGEAGVEGLGEPQHGGSEIGRRAVAFAEQQGR